MKLSDIKSNPNNPRVIKDDKFRKLVKSIEEFPKMMVLRPMIINNDNIVLGGNMRLKALKELGYKDIPEDWVKRADDLTEEEARRFIIADNVGFGEHNYKPKGTTRNKTCVCSLNKKHYIFQCRDGVYNHPHAQKTCEYSII